MSDGYTSFIPKTPSGESGGCGRRNESPLGRNSTTFILGTCRSKGVAGLDCFHFWPGFHCSPSLLPLLTGIEPFSFIASTSDWDFTVLLLSVGSTHHCFLESASTEMRIMLVMKMNQTCDVCHDQWLKHLLPVMFTTMDKSHVVYLWCFLWLVTQT